MEETSRFDSGHRLHNLYRGVPEVEDGPILEIGGCKPVRVQIASPRFDKGTCLLRIF